MVYVGDEKSWENTVTTRSTIEGDSDLYADRQQRDAVVSRFPFGIKVAVTLLVDVSSCCCRPSLLDFHSLLDIDRDPSL